MFNMNHKETPTNTQRETGWSFYTQDNEFKTTNKSKYRLLMLGSILVVGMFAIISVVFVFNDSQYSDENLVNTIKSESPVQAFQNLIQSEPKWENYNIDDSYTKNIQHHFIFETSLDETITVVQKDGTTPAVEILTNFFEMIARYNFYSFYEITNLQHGTGDHLKNRFQDISILSNNKLDTDENEILKESGKDQESVSCCLEDQEVYNAMSGVARVLTYINRYQKDEDGDDTDMLLPTKDYLFTMYEGFVHKADPENFGRMIVGFGNFSFIGFFKPCESHGFFCTHTQKSTGVYINKERKQGHIQAEYHGIYSYGQNWEFECPTQEDEDDEWLKTKKGDEIKFQSWPYNGV